MKRLWNTRILAGTTLAVLLALYATQSVTVMADSPPQGRSFIRIRIVGDSVTALSSGNALLELSVDGSEANTPIELIEGKSVTGEVQVPFNGGDYAVTLKQGESDLMRVRGHLIAMEPGEYEHTASETFAEPTALAFAQDGPALIVEAGSVQGSAVLLLMVVGDNEVDISLALDADGDGLITDGDVTAQAVLLGPQVVLETPLVDDLPLTSVIQVEARINNTQVLRIEGPYDLAGMRATSQPLQELKQGLVQAALVYLKRTPLLTRIEIPAVKFAPPSETVQIQPQASAQNALAAFGDTEALKSLFQSVDAITEPPFESTDTEASDPGEDSAASTDETATSVKGPSESVSAMLSRFISEQAPLAVTAGIVVVAVIMTCILWVLASRGRHTTKTQV